MSRPYYEDESVTLYLGDCREVLEWLDADVLLTDPPYGRGWKSGGVGDHRPHDRGIQNDDDTAVRDAVVALWGHARPGLVFGDPLIPAPTGVRQALVYLKAPDGGAHGAMGGWRRDVEMVWLVGKWPAGIGGVSSALRSGARMDGGSSGLASRYGHPHAKPLDVLQELLSHCPPGVVADPCAGSGSTLVAAKLAGRRAIGVEIDEKYAETCARRLAQGVLLDGVG